MAESARWAWVAIALALAGCDDATGDSGGAEQTCDRSPPLTWDSFGEAYVGRHCAGCHSSLLPEGMRTDATLGVDLDTYSGNLQWAERSLARATGDEPTMPPGGGPSEVEIAMFEEWLRCSVLPDAAALAEEGR